MKIIVDEAGEIIAKTTDDHTLIGGHHRLAWPNAGCSAVLDLDPAIEPAASGFNGEGNSVGEGWVPRSSPAPR